MYSQRSQPSPPLKRSFSGDSQNSYASHASQATTVSRASSRLLFGEISLTPATTTDGRSMRSNGSICNLVLSTSSVFLRFWLNDNARDNMLAHMESEDLANFRLVCHDMSTRAAPFLFESITTTFKSSTFSKPARIEALSRIGQHVKTLTFHMPHSPDAFLPPIIDPETGEEKQFIYEPQMTAQTGPAKDKTPKYGTWEMQDLLVKQYPPLFHAATNVPAFVNAFSELCNLTHLKVSCPGGNSAPRHRRSVVDYALISLRIAVERAPLFSLSELSLHPIHAGGLLYLHPMHGFGSTPQSAKRWSQIRRLSICMESISLNEQNPRAQAQSLEHLRILHAYLRTLSRGVTRLFFRWKGQRGPSPLSLDREPCMQPIDEEDLHPSMRGEASSKGPRPLKFSRLRYMTLENALMDSTQISDFIEKHRRSLVEFNFEDVKLREGNWEDALEPLTIIAGNDYWKKTQEEVMDVPIMLSPIDAGPRIMGPLIEEVDMAIEEASGKERNAHTLSRWLTKPARSTHKKSPVIKDSFFGADHMKRFLRISSWK